ncbi:3-hydroxyacyl-ACP dehydratase FabZ [Ammonifex thiophilus]|uniref:3-hydroxyacyl-[acyl-carrier-protein] dehydratase FabZ n=1 Tax=Ammonifex thiophilus TaxID=444093 RepID=A0A3D8P5X4_9THEO|nr:3-hydroxyacyl-ACP dehydratase FabZ [Ammonifex thiophilus]RDV84730.1 3-hydroxyacyl-[acyl-carrier-protein] dehydratase FabZ [Ammonifex thiophilus]
MMDVRAIQKLLPHRYPFLLLDRVTLLEPGKRAVGIKNVTVNEPFFTGHFPGYPVMPGVLILEALAQLTAVAVLKLADFQDKIPLLAGIDKARFRRPVFPGDTLRLEVEVLRLKGMVGKAKGQAWVGEELAAEAEIVFAAGERKSEEEKDGI